MGCETRYGEPGGQAIFKKDGSNQIAMAAKPYSPFTPWTQIGSSSFTFSTEPACATFDGAVDGPFPSRQFAIVAKGSGSANRYWYATWQQGEISTTFGEPPSVGNLVRDWQLVGNDAFASAPAATVHNGKLLVLGRTSDNQLMMRSYPLNLGNSGDPTAFGGPVAIGGNLGGDSAHVVFAKKPGSDNLFMTASVPNVE
jgi:hypothetical protein